MLKSFWHLIILMILFISCKGDEIIYDTEVLVYGATSGGITAAIQAARMGDQVILIEPSNHIGGTTTGGLVWTDYGQEGVVGGLAGEFYNRVTQHYKSDAAWKVEDPFRQRLLNEKLKYIKSFEPRVADSIYHQMLSEAGIQLIIGERLDLESGVEKKDNKITSVTFETGKTLKAKVFIDATYEGDLMALAGVSYHVGRESADTYNESLAGVLPDDSTIRQPKRYFNKVDPWIRGANLRGYSRVDPYDKEGNLLYGIQNLPLEAPGAGDDKVQAYNVRIVLTTDPDNLIPITKPADYDSTKYELLIRYVNAHQFDHIRQVLFKIDPVPNQKTDINDGCPYSTDYIGANWDYPEADYARREEILGEHHSFTKGLIYFIGHDPRMPASIRSEMLRYGYPKDEYVNNNHWTPQVYIRETRRMIGEYVMTQNDIDTNTQKEHSVGMGSYALDSHHIQRLVTKDGELINEGNFTIHINGPYEIPYESLIPKEKECANLIVPVCVSSSHVAFGSIRMEPVYMVLGQTAGTAASLALKEDNNVHRVEYENLRSQLIQDGQTLKYVGSNTKEEW
ncbi:MAG: FAD-dependent oxidoreductase [Bacteroidota bacterium]